MNKSESKLISILLAIIIIFSCILIYKIQTKPEYDQTLYDQIYAEYEDIQEIAENKEKKENDDIVQEDNHTKNKKESVSIIANSHGEKYRVAGKISIPKINISYPIVYETTKEYLKIAPTKLAGPDINEIGNACIVAHNYRNKKFFSRIKELEVKDKIYLTANTGEEIAYEVYDKYEVNEKDLDCINQETEGNIEATLITCTTKRSNRLVVKCRAVS